MATTVQSLRVGFIGLGVMGAPMAARLLGAGFACRVFDINPQAVAALAEQGATACTSAAEAASTSDVFVSVMVDDKQLHEALFGAGDAAAALAPGAVVIGMSTMRRTGVQRIAEQLAERGFQYLDAPMSGGAVRAGAGDLTIMASGPDALVERCRPLLEAMGSNIYHVGQRIGDGQAVKMVNQLLVAVHNVAAAEALAFGAQLGLDQALLFDIISNSAGNSWIWGDRGQRMVERAWTLPPKSALSIIAKDIGFVTEAAATLGQAVPLADTAQALYQRAMAQGMQPLDDSVMLLLLEQLGKDEPHA